MNTPIPQYLPPSPPSPPAPPPLLPSPIFLPPVKSPVIDVQVGNNWATNIMVAKGDLSFLFGGQQSDLLVGGEHGMSFLNGAGGNDAFVARGGTTYVTTGLGPDQVLILQTQAPAKVVITDFVRGQDEIHYSFKGPYGWGDVNLVPLLDSVGKFGPDGATHVWIDHTDVAVVGFIPQHPVYWGEKG